MPDDQSLSPNLIYERDFHGWTLRQAAALSVLASALRDADLPAGSVRAAIEVLDLENLVEEVGDLARRDRQELARRIATIVEHLIKLAHGRDQQPKPGWMVMVRRSRNDIAELLADSPSLRSFLPEAIERGRLRGWDEGRKALRDCGDDQGAAIATLRGSDWLEAPQILKEWWPGCSDPINGDAGAA